MRIKYVTNLEIIILLQPDINLIAGLGRDGSILKAVEGEVGELPMRL